MHRSSTGLPIGKFPNVGNQSLNSLSPTSQRYILQPLAAGIHSPSSQPSWVEHQPELKLSCLPHCPSSNRPCDAKLWKYQLFHCPALCSLFPAQVGTGQCMPVFLWGPQIFMNDYFNAPPYLLSCFFGFQGLDNGVGHLFCLGYLRIVRRWMPAWVDSPPLLKLFSFLCDQLFFFFFLFSDKHIY